MVFYGNEFFSLETDHANSMQRYINNQFKEYIGLSFFDIARVIGLNPDLMKSKLSTVTLIKKMMEFVSFSENDLIDGKHINSISLKTVRLTDNGKAKESMSFEQVKFNEIINETWENSTLRKKFIKTSFLFVVFEYGTSDISPNNLFLRGFYLWKMPKEVLDTEIRKVWTRTHDLVINGLEVEEVNQGNKTVSKNNLPGISFNPVAHIRPKASNASDKVLLPNGKIITKQAFWLNGSYISGIVNQMPPLQKKRPIHKNEKELDRHQLKKIKSNLLEPVYTYDDFMDLAGGVIQDFKPDYYNSTTIKELGYKIYPHYIVSQSLGNPDKYFEEKILEGDYFLKSDNSIHNSDPFVRKMKNLENSLDIVPIEADTYITIKKLNEAGITKRDMWDFKSNVEQFIEDGNFFTWKSIEREGFQHYLMDYGFDEIFYESLLKRPGAFKAGTLSGTALFQKTFGEFNISSFFFKLLEQSDSMSLEKLQDSIYEKFMLKLNRDELLTFINRQATLFYSKDLERLFVDKEAYFDYIEFK